ncbi:MULTISPECIES: 30S ribosomal protein S20 [unclassified Rummeliibacillus]|uniref:30S ribosomal protein S20 n=1 Tax=unclassified Rummeliibacillus TaxID=2622809 RepID=UPI000E675A0B|nr:MULTISPECIES: 30S ribosomal protein S20 [unclassified Rummeliibacillus]RIJ67549.1 30S ribosomal protein S20 [Rummeliibacillus sp. POC4]RPJ97109.1 30S ribosomal protein S20 [Rummeliibacillus sp. TYF005]
MPNIKSAIKRVKTASEANAQNAQAKSAMRTAVKKADAALVAKDENAKELVKVAVKTLDKAASKGLIHKNAASRQKARLMKKA